MKSSLSNKERYINSSIKINEADYKSNPERVRALVYQQLSNIYHALSKGFVINHPIMIVKLIIDNDILIEFMVSNLYYGLRKAKQMKYQLPSILRQYRVVGFSKEDYVYLPEEVLFNCELQLPTSEPITNNPEVLPSE